MTRSVRISVAIAVHNEESVLAELLRRLRAVLDLLPGGPHQIVFVDDGSTDRTLVLLEEEAHRDSRILVVALSRNFGHQAALTAALDHVRGDVTIVMDGDLQDVPEAIPLFVEKFFDGFDVVYAKRTGRKEPWTLRACYFIFYRVLARMSDSSLALDSGDFALMSRRVVDHLRELPEHHRYLRGLRSWVGFRQIGIEVERAERHAGRSKYGFLRLVKLASDGLFAFSIVPIRAAAMLGAATVALSGVYAVYSVYVRFVRGQSPRGFTAQVLLFTFLSGVLLFFLGIIGEYVGRVYEEVKARPHYIVGRVIGNVSPVQPELAPEMDGSASTIVRASRPC